jgi:hypothetical protein
MDGRFGKFLGCFLPFLGSVLLAGSAPWWVGMFLEKTETITVNADSIKGTPWKNYENRAVIVKYDATKQTNQWLAIPEKIRDRRIPNEAKRYLSPNGAPNFESNITVCARVPLGALVVIGKTVPRCKAYSAQGSFRVNPGEEVYFMMNDINNPEMYTDNRGTIEVKLAISRI